MYEQKKEFRENVEIKILKTGTFFIDFYLHEMFTFKLEYRFTFLWEEGAEENNLGLKGQ